MKMFLSICLGLISLGMSAQDTNLSWQIISSQQPAQKRHESSMVECDGKFYALGGRGNRPIEEFDPKTSNWTVLADAPMEFHHFQAISFQHEIYVIGALTGSYPHEKPIPHFLIFNPKTKTWRQGASIPAERVRGSVGVFTRGTKIYLVAGIIDGHYDGHVTWFDEYDTKNNTWKVLPDAPRARDHFQAVMVGKDKAYVAGGRTSHAKIGKVLDLCIKEVDVFDFKTNQWSTLVEGLPTLRAGTSSLGIGPYLVVMNGESVKQVPGHAEVEVLDTRKGTWFSLPNLKQGRHGTGVVYWKGKIYVVAGSANRGGGPELNEMECLSWK